MPALSFGARHIPMDNRIQTLLDPVAPHYLFPLYVDLRGPGSG